MVCYIVLVRRDAVLMMIYCMSVVYPWAKRMLFGCCVTLCKLLMIQLIMMTATVRGTGDDDDVTMVIMILHQKQIMMTMLFLVMICC